jgi:hypothetical protein
MRQREKQPWNPFPLACLKVEGLSACAKAVLIYLGVRSNYKGETCVGYRTIQRELVRSKDFVTTGLKELRNKGYLEESQRDRHKHQADWKTLNASLILKSRTESSPDSEEIGPEEQDQTQMSSPDFGRSSPAQQGKTSQIDSNLADSIFEPTDQIQNLGVSQSVSQRVSAAVAASNDSSPSTDVKPAELSVLASAHAGNPNPPRPQTQENWAWMDALAAQVGWDAIDDSEELVKAVYPASSDAHRKQENMVKALRIRKETNQTVTDWRTLLHYNRTHKSGALLIRSLDQWLKIDHERMANDWKLHGQEKSESCKICKADTSRYKPQRKREDICRECGLAGHNDDGNSPSLCPDCHQVRVDRMKGEAVGKCQQCSRERRITGTPICIACLNGWSGEAIGFEIEEGV